MSLSSSLNGMQLAAISSRFRYVKCDGMAAKAVAAVEKGELKILPDIHVNTWYRYLRD